MMMIITILTHVTHPPTCSGWGFAHGRPGLFGPLRYSFPTNTLTNNIHPAIYLQPLWKPVHTCQVCSQPRTVAAPPSIVVAWGGWSFVPRVIVCGGVFLVVCLCGWPVSLWHMPSLFTATPDSHLFRLRRRAWTAWPLWTYRPFTPTTFN